MLGFSILTCCTPIDQDRKKQYCRQFALGLLLLVCSLDCRPPVLYIYIQYFIFISYPFFILTQTRNQQNVVSAMVGIGRFLFQPMVPWWFPVPLILVVCEGGAGIPRRQPKPPYFLFSFDVIQYESLLFYPNLSPCSPQFCWFSSQRGATDVER